MNMEEKEDVVDYDLTLPGETSQNSVRSKQFVQLPNLQPSMNYQTPTVAVEYTMP